MENIQETKNNHWVAITHQKKFISEIDGLLHYATIDEYKKIWLTNNEKRGFPCYYRNNVEEKIYDQTSEDHLANNIDYHYNNSVDLINQRAINCNIDKNNLLQIINLFLYGVKLVERNPRTYKNIKGLVEKEKEDEEGLNKFICDFEDKIGFKLPPFDYVNSLKNALNPKEIYNKTLIKEIKEYMGGPAFNQFFKDKIWVFLHNTTNIPFIISCNPVIINQGEIKVGFPMTKNIYFAVFQPESDNYFIHHLDFNNIDKINELNMEQVNRFKRDGKYLMGGENEEFLKKLLK
jgi:hypothetical protein